MVTIKCSNCKASIPDGATFCPSCGSPRNVQQQAPQSYQPQQTMYSGPMSSRSSSPLEGVFDMVFSKTAIIIGVAIGLLLVWISYIITLYAPGSVQTALLIASMGFADMSLMLTGGGLWNNKIDKFVRLAMVFIGIWAIVQTMSIVNIYFSSLSRLI